MTNNVTRGSANVFADLGFENPDEELPRAQLAVRVRDLIKGRKLTQSEAAKILRVAQPDVSAIVNGRVRGLLRWSAYAALFGEWATTWRLRSSSRDQQEPEDVCASALRS